jgi:transposase
MARSAQAAGIDVVVCAPGKTPRASGDRVKTDRKDAELLARLLLAGQLRSITVPPDWLEAARHLSRARESVRGDLARARHRVSKLLLVEGRVYASPTTWNRAHRQWLGRQQFAQPATELAFIDALAAVDGLTARREALDERLSRIAQDDRLWPTVARLRAFRGIDTLTALLLHLELGGDWQRFRSPRRLSAWLGLTPTLAQSGQSKTQGSITKTGSTIARRTVGRVSLALPAPTQNRRDAAKPPAGPARSHPADLLARPAPPSPRPPRPPPTRQTRQRRHDRRRPTTRRVPLGRRHRPMT